MWTRDAYGDFQDKETAEHKWLMSRPKCEECGEHIQDEMAYRLPHGWVCEECINLFYEVIGD